MSDVSEPRIDSASHKDAADLLRAHQARLFQHAQVLHGRGQRHGQRPGELGHRRGALAQPLHHRPPGGVGERAEQAVQIGRLVKHMPNYHRLNS